MIGPSFQENADAVLIFSGGLDSATLLYKLLSEGKWIHALTFDYNQRHKKEIECAANICKLNGIPHKVIDITNLAPLLGDSSLLGGKAVPDCHYTEDSAKQTIVPNRNMIMLSIAAGYAEAHEIPEIYYAAHAGDWAIYPDCRKSFIDSAAETIKLATAWHTVTLKAPFAEMTKKEIASLGRKLEVPFELTWSCYRGGDKPCGTCPTCIERQEALNEN